MSVKIRRRGDWEAIGLRNEWFQGKAVSVLEGMRDSERGGVLFSYSYTARRLFEWAQQNDHLCVLGQIDPGPEEHRWVNERVSESSPDATEKTSGPPSQYWDHWRQEVELADCILVNSAWSQQLLERGGVSPEKMKIVPLAYERSTSQCSAGPKSYPGTFDARRPLRVLFLGQVIRRKGVMPLLEAADRMRDEAVEFLMAGPDPEGLLDHRPENPGIKALGAVDRVRAEQLYAEADVFILPTFSDGFAITQLEAAAHRLPLIVSHYCGEVVESGKNGWVLPEVSADAIVEVLERFLGNPAQLEAYSAFEMNWERFSLAALGQNLQEAEDQAREYSHGRRSEKKGKNLKSGSRY